MDRRHLDKRRAAEVRGDGVGVERRAHQDEAEPRPRSQHVLHENEQEVGADVPLVHLASHDLTPRAARRVKTGVRVWGSQRVHFVDDDVRDVVQQRLLLQLAQQHPRRAVLDGRVWPRTRALVADAVPDRLADLSAGFGRIVVSDSEVPNMQANLV